MELAAGSTFAHYTIEAMIGRGGMGEVYRAQDERLKRPVALKVVRTHAGGNPEEAVARLLREARAAAALNHPNVVAIHDLGEAADRFFIVMELIRGRSLAEYIGKGDVPRDQKLKWVREMACALSAAHEAGLVHRDVKPGNVMVTTAGTVKVLDFGLARPVSANGEFRTAGGWILGTPRYMAPEQLKGAEADGRSDQYALALTACELLVGIHPGGPISAMATARRSLSGLVPSSVCDALVRMLSTEPEHRFATLAEALPLLEESRVDQSDAVTLVDAPTAEVDAANTERATADSTPPPDTERANTQAAALVALRTRLANDLHSLADAMPRTLAGSPLEKDGWSMHLARPEGHSASGSPGAVQPLVITSSRGMPAMVLGHVDVEAGKARLRTYEAMRHHYASRFENGDLPIKEEAYGQLLALTTLGLRLSGVPERIFVSPPNPSEANEKTAPTPKKRTVALLVVLATLMLIAIACAWTLR